MLETMETDLLSHLTFEPLTTANWLKFVQLFGEKGACGNCWCMYYRLTKAEWTEGKYEDGNKEALHELVRAQKPTGMLGFYEGQAVAWAAFAPREDFTKLSRSRVHKRIDGLAVWSIPCLYIHKDFRRLGVSVALLKGLVKYATEQGIGVIEAYPTIPTKGVLPDSFVWTGLYSAYLKAGFEVVDRTSRNRPMVRYYTKL
jgi:GNAT superfamily N-acetyltransferase